MGPWEPGWWEQQAEEFRHLPDTFWAPREDGSFLQELGAQWEGTVAAFPLKVRKLEEEEGKRRSRKERVGKEEGESRGTLGKEARGKRKQTFPQRDFQKPEKDLAKPFPNHPGV